MNSRDFGSRENLYLDDEQHRDFMETICVCCRQSPVAYPLRQLCLACGDLPPTYENSLPDR